MDGRAGNSGKGKGKGTALCGPTLRHALYKRYVSESLQKPSQRITTVIPSSQIRKPKHREVGHLVQVTQQRNGGAGIPETSAVGQLSKEKRAGFRLRLSQSLARAGESFRLRGTPLLTRLPWLPSALQIKAKLREALKALRSGLCPPPTTAPGL